MQLFHISVLSSLISYTIYDLAYLKKFCSAITQYYPGHITPNHVSVGKLFIGTFYHTEVVMK